MALKLVLLVAAAAVMVVVTEGLPRYIAIPVEDLRLVRRVRSMPQYEQYPQSQPRMPVMEKRGDSSEALVADGSDNYARQAGYGGNDHVDYGAYTGGYGAFGWYTDHPVCINCGYGYH